MGRCPYLLQLQFHIIMFVYSVDRILTEGLYFSCQAVNTGMHHIAQGDLGTLIGQPHSMAKTKQGTKGQTRNTQQPVYDYIYIVTEMPVTYICYRRWPAPMYLGVSAIRVRVKFQLSLGPPHPRRW